MTRPLVRSLAWALILFAGALLVGCGGDEQKDHKDHQAQPNGYK